MAISKVILNGETLMDVTSDTVEADKLLSGETATKNDGTKVTGNYAVNIQPLIVESTDEEQVFDESNVTTVDRAALPDSPMDSGEATTLTSELSFYTGGALVIGQKYHLTGCFGTGDTDETAQIIFFDTDWVARENLISIPFTTKPGRNDEESVFDGSIEFTDIKLSMTQIVITATAPFVVYTYLDFEDMNLAFNLIGEPFDGYMPVTVKPMPLAPLYVNPKSSTQTYTPRTQAVGDWALIRAKSTTIESTTDWNTIVFDYMDDLVSGSDYYVNGRIYNASGRRLKCIIHNGPYTYEEGTPFTFKLVDRHEHTDAGTLTMDIANGRFKVDSSVIEVDDMLSFFAIGPYISGFSDVTVKSATLQNKTDIKPTESTQIITADSGYYGLSTVTVNGMKLQEKTVTPSESSQTIIADGESLLDVKAVTPTFYNASNYTYKVNTLTSSRNMHRMKVQGSGRIIYDGSTNVFSIDTIITYETNKKINIKFDESNGATQAMHIGEIYIPQNSVLIWFTMYSAQPSTKRSMIIDNLNIQDLDSSSGYDALKQVTVNAIASDYIGSAIPLKSAADLIESDGVISVPYGFYSQSTSMSLALASLSLSYTFTSSTGNYWIQAKNESRTGHYLSSNAMMTVAGTIPTLSAQTITVGSQPQYISSYRWLTGVLTIEQGPIYTMYKRLAQKLEIRTSNVSYASEFSDYCTAMTSIVHHEFAGQEFIGDLSFPNLTSVGYAGFTWTIPGMNYEASNRGSATITFPKITRFIQGTFANNTNIGTIIAPSCSIVSDNAFSGCYFLSSITLSSAIEIRAAAFCRCSKLSHLDAEISSTIPSSAFMDAGLLEARYPDVSQISDSAFYGCKSLSSIYFPACTYVGYNAFAWCTNLLEITEDCFPLLSQIYCISVFKGCSSLTSVCLPNCERLAGRDIFTSCSALRTVSLPKCSYIAPSIFYNCDSLSVLYLPELLSVDKECFYSLKALESVNFPKCSLVGESAFYSCKSLRTVNLSACTSLSKNAFGKCESLQTISIPICTRIGSYAFMGCHNLMEVYLDKVDNVPSLGGDDVFYYTPISNSTYTGSFGSIYAPASLYDAFVSAAYWSRYSSRIVSV